MEKRWSLAEDPLLTRKFPDEDARSSWPCFRVPQRVLFSPKTRLNGRTSSRVAVVTSPQTLKLVSDDAGGEAGEMTICWKDPITCMAFGYARFVADVWPWLAMSSENAEDGVHLVLATGHSNGDIFLWSGDTSQLITKLTSHRNVVTQLVFSSVDEAADGQGAQLISGSLDRHAKVWDFEGRAGFNMSQSVAFSKPVHAVAWSPVSRRVALAGSAGRMCVYAKSGHLIGRRIHEMAGHFDTVCALKFWPDGALLLSASWDTRVHLWDVESGTILKTLCHAYPVPTLFFPLQVNCVDVDELGRAIVTVCDDNKLRLWSLTEPDVAAAAGRGRDNLVADPVLTVDVREGQDHSSTVFCSFVAGNNSAAPAAASRLTVTKVVPMSSRFYAVKMPVPGLKHICRIAVRKAFPSVAGLPRTLPKCLVAYLSYEEWL